MHALWRTKSPVFVNVQPCPRALQVMCHAPSYTQHLPARPPTRMGTHRRRRTDTIRNTYAVSLAVPNLLSPRTTACRHGVAFSMSRPPHACLPSSSADHPFRPSPRVPRGASYPVRATGNLAPAPRTSRAATPRGDEAFRTGSAAVVLPVSPFKLQEEPFPTLFRFSPRDIQEGRHGCGNRLKA